MRCIVCNNESLNLNAKFCSKCGNKLVSENYFCKHCGKKILKKANFCTNCGIKLDNVFIDYDSKYKKCTEDKIKEETKENAIIIKYNKEEMLNMGNNVIKENCLEIMPNQEIKVKQEENILPQVKIDNSMLLPVIIKDKELALVEIKNEINILKENKTLVGLLKFVKATVKILAKLVRGLFMASAGVIGFVGVSILVIVSTAIITKNIVNSYYGASTEVDSTYSIFQMKDNETKTTMKK